MWESRSVRFPHFHTTKFPGRRERTSVTLVCELPLSAAQREVPDVHRAMSCRSNGLESRSLMS
jgi:hypothetical protein